MTTKINLLRGYTIKMHKHAHFVITIWRLGEVETQQVVRFGTVLPVTHHQLASLSAAETEVLVCVFALWPQLPLLWLQLGIPGFLLLLHHHCTLDQTSQKERHQTQLPKVWTALETGSRRSMSSPLAAPRGIRSSCLTHSYKMFSCCPHSGGCSWMSALCLQEYSTLNKSFSLVGMHEMYKDTRRRSSRNSNSSSIYLHSPASMSQSAKSPMRTSPFTVHFCVSQFGLQLWFIKRAEFPLGPASITRSCEGRTKEKKKPNSWQFRNSWLRFSNQSITLVPLMLPWWGWACRSWSHDFHEHVWFAVGTPLNLSPLPHTRSQSHPKDKQQIYSLHFLMHRTDMTAKEGNITVKDVNLWL